MSTRVRIARAAALAALPVMAILGLPANGVRADSLLAPIWTGAYVGVHGGANWSDIDTDFNSKFSATDATGGGHIGYNLGLGGILVGVEADADINGADASFASAGGGTSSLSTDWNGTIRARAGLPIGPALLYATAGYAWSGTSLAEKNSSGATFSSSHTFTGVVYGVGAEAYVFPNMSVRLEALRYDYGADKISISGFASSVQEIDPSDTVVRAGITFHLN